MSVRRQLRLQLIDEPTAAAILAGECPPGLRCADDYPAEGDQVAARLFLERCAAGLDPRPFGAYLVCLTEPGTGAADLAIGGVGFHGGVDQGGRVEVGYGIVASQQGLGFATAALRLLVVLARELGVSVLAAETEEANAASQAVLRRNGFVTQWRDEGGLGYERPLR